MRTAKNMSCSKIIRRRRREAETRNGYIQLLARIILVIVCGGLLFTQGFLLMRAPDNGMFPAIKGCVFLLGDYRTQTKDSRDYGPIKMEDVKAKVITVLRRREL